MKQKQPKIGRKDKIKKRKNKCLKQKIQIKVAMNVVEQIY